MIKKLSVVFSSGGIVLEKLNFLVRQGDRVLVEDVLSGKISTSFIRTYQVNANESTIEVVFPNGKFAGLNVSASIS